MRTHSPARLRAYGLDQDTRQTLHRIGQTVVPHLDTVLTDFYRDVVATPDWAAFFRDPGLMAHAKSRQIIHWERMLTAEYGEDYFAQADRIGRIHYKIGLPLHHYVASYARIAAALHRILADQRAPGRFRQGLCGRRLRGEGTRPADQRGQPFDMPANRACQSSRPVAPEAATTAAGTNEMAGRVHDVSTRVERSGATAQTLREAVATVSGETDALSDRVRRFLGALRAA